MTAAVRSMIYVEAECEDLTPLIIQPPFGEDPDRVLSTSYTYEYRLLCRRQI
jgi:hypothetical protein